MRIAMVSEHASPLAVLGEPDAGGQNVHVAALGRALADRGHQVEVFTRRDGSGMPGTVPLYRSLVGGGQVDVVHVPAGPARAVPKDELAGYMPEFGAWLGRRWRLRRPDVVHAHFWMSALAARAAGRRVGVPVAVTFHALGVVKRRHQGEADTSPAVRCAQEARLARSVDAVIATCSDEVDELLALGARPERLHVVPCGVDVSLFRPDGPAAPRNPRVGYRVLSVGRLVRRKGMDTLVEALAEVPDTELVVAGGPPAAALGTDPEARRLLDLAHRVGVADRFRMVGGVPRPELAALMRSADVVACTPWYEPFGIVPLEAMACGVPVLATEVGGMLDTVVPGVTGRRVPPQDPRGTAAALRELLVDGGRRRAMGTAGVARARARFGWDRVAELTESVYSGFARLVPEPALTPQPLGRMGVARTAARVLRPEPLTTGTGVFERTVRAEGAAR
jgi:glycosyltransferase involved in cell wall biosynthesis